MTKKEKEECAKQMDRELEAAIDANVIQLSPNVVQARMLLCVIRAGTAALVGNRASPTIARDLDVFKLFGSIYVEHSLGLRAMLKQFDSTTEERMTALAEDLVRGQLSEMLGKSLADALIKRGGG